MRNIKLLFLQRDCILQIQTKTHAKPQEGMSDMSLLFHQQPIMNMICHKIQKLLKMKCQEKFK